MNNESHDFVDHCDYLELENITSTQLKSAANEC